MTPDDTPIRQRIFIDLKGQDIDVVVIGPAKKQDKEDA